MSDKSNKYGYVLPTVPTQEQGSNTGVFSTNEIYSLVQAGNWSEIDALELIQKITLTGTTHQLEFTSIRGSEFTNYLLIMAGNYQVTTASTPCIRLSTDGGTTYVSTGYQYSGYYIDTLGNFDDTDRSTNENRIRIGKASTSATLTGNAIVYLNNLSDTSRYSFIYCKDYSGQDSGTKYLSSVRGALYPQTTEVNAIKIFSANGTSDMHGTFFLFGIKDFK